MQTARAGDAAEGLGFCFPSKPSGFRGVLSDAGPEVEAGIVLSRLVKQITRPRVGQVKRASTFHQRKSINLYLIMF